MSSTDGANIRVDGAKVRTLRKLRGESLVTFAPKVGICFQYLSQIERGDRRVSPQTFARLCDELGVRNRAKLVRAGRSRAVRS